jgi:hypothetical protein
MKFLNKIKFFFYQKWKELLWPLRKKFPILINNLDDPRNVACLCQSCGNYIKGKSYHLGFSNLIDFYCSNCEAVLLIGTYDLKLESFQKLKERPFETFNRHEIPYWDQIATFFTNCECGGNFAYLNPPRCPKCKGLLRGNCYEDKPILKDRDGYVFVCGKSYSGKDLIKPEFKNILVSA